MKKLSAVSDTLYVPLLGRIYAAKHHPDVLEDKTALKIAGQLTQSILQMQGQNEYTYLASAVRSRNMDEYIQDFLCDNPRGIIINTGCGLETTFQRNDNGKAVWFELDLPEVLELRGKYLPEQERDRFLPYSMFDYRWMEAVQASSKTPVLLLASGLFHYFTNEEVVDFLRQVSGFYNVQIVFDTVSKVGLKISQHYVKKMGKEDAQMFFAVSSVKRFAQEISDRARVLDEKKYYRVNRFPGKMKFETRLKMIISDRLNMVKMIHLQLNG